MVKEHRRTVVAAVALAAIGSAALAGRMWSRRGRPAAVEAPCWRLRYAVIFPADRPGVSFRAALPDNTPSCLILRESLSGSGVSWDGVRNPRTGGRGVVGRSLGTSDEARFAAEFDIQVVRRPVGPRPEKDALSPGDRLHFLRAETDIQSDGEAVRKVLAGFGDVGNDPARLLARIFAHCQTAIARDQRAGASDAAGALAGKTAGALGRARAMVALCRGAGIPARLVAGFIVRRDSRAQAHVWVEAYLAERWLPYDPEHGHAAGNLPPEYLPVRRDGSRIVRGPRGLDLTAAFSIEPLAPDPAGPIRARRSPADIADLTRLPAGMRHTLAVLLLLPAGALVTSVFRNAIGLATFGTFTPALLALSFLYADLLTGLVVFVLVLTIGLTARVLLDRFRLLMVPRLSVMLTLIVACLTTAISVLDYLGLTPSARAVVFPMVIMTMTIERFYVCYEEEGFGRGLRLLGGTVVVAACCLGLLRWEVLGSLALAYPESLFFVGAALLMMGRYSGYRLSELVRFRDLARPPQKQEGP